MKHWYRSLSQAASSPACSPRRRRRRRPRAGEREDQWKDDSAKLIHLTWEEDVSRPNVVFVRPVGRVAEYRTPYR